MEASSAREAARRLSPTRREGSHLTWTSASFTGCGEVTTAKAKALREDWDPSEEHKEGAGCQIERDGLLFLAAIRHMD